MSRGSVAGEILSPRARRVVLFVALASGVGLVMTLLWGARFSSPEAGETDSYGGGPLGHRAFAETLEALGYHVLQSRGDRFDGPSAPMLFLEPEVEARVEGRRRLLVDALEAREAAGLESIVVLPKWRFELGLHATEPPVVLTHRTFDVWRALTKQMGPAEPPEAEATGADEDEEAPPDGSAHLASGLHVGDDDHGRHTLVGVLGSFEVEVPRLQTIQSPPPGADVLLDAATGAVVLRDARGTLIVSDPDLLHNFNLHRGDHALLWETLLRDLGADTIVIDEVFHGHGKVLSLGDALGRFPAILLVAQALFVIFLLLLVGSRRFGPPEEEAALGAGPREAIAVAASVLADGQPLGRLTYNYVVEVLQDIHRHLGLPDVSTLDARAARIDALARQRRVPEAAQRLLAEAAALAPRAKVGAEAWTLARAAHTFRLRMLEPTKGAVRPSTSPRPEENAA